MKKNRQNPSLVQNGNGREMEITHRSKRKCKKFTMFMLCLPIVIYSVVTYFQEPLYVYINTDTNSECVLPDIDPFDQTIMKYFYWHPPPIVCDPNPSIIVIDDDGLVHFNESLETSMKAQGVTCTYSIVELTDDFHVKFLPEKDINPPQMVHSDFFVGKCKNAKGDKIYENLHHKIDNQRTKRTKTFEAETDEDLSVIIFGVDSLSRLAAYRKLPKTVDYLQNKLGGYVFKGQTKVGDHTFPNLIALFTGKTQIEQPEVNLNLDPCEKYPLIFQNFSKLNYVTLHGEDWPEIATFNQVMPKGFTTPPTDHYLRPFFLAMRKISPHAYNLNNVVKFLVAKTAINFKKTSPLCYGNRPNHMLVVDYYKQFLTSYKGKKKFSFTWLNELGHDFVNFFELGDNDFMEFIQWMHSEGHLDKSVLIFMGDHGSRVDEIRNTYIGRIEDRMPFLSIVIPEKLKKKYPHIHENLSKNQEKLTSTYDIFETMSDILHKKFNQTEPARKTGPRSVSLFRKVPEKRSCADARIPHHYCACFSAKKLQTTDPFAIRLGKFVVSEILKIISHVMDQCIVVYLEKVTDAILVTNNFERKSSEERFTIRNWLFKPEEKKSERYMITLKVAPSNATYEATIRRQMSDGSLHIVDDIVRTNRFGKTSKCMSVRILRDFCYCKHQPT